MNANEKTKVAVDTFDRAAVSYAEKFMDVSCYQPQLETFCEHLKPHVPSLLELACGPGNLTKVLLALRPDLNMLATDLAPNMLKIASEINPTATFELLDVRALGQLKQTFDGIVNGFGLPYLSKSDAITFIAAASQRLNPEGLLYLSTMEDDYSKSGLKQGSDPALPPIYMHYHQADYLIEALEQQGFEVIDLSRIHTQMTTGETVTDLIIIAKRVR